MYGYGADYGPLEYCVNVGCVKGGGFLECPSNCELVKKGFAYHEVSVVIVIYFVCKRSQVQGLFFS